uniref:UDP-N-acetylglucosamine 2-epimerase n=1 Tax=uncultured gamma proteobacterium HF0500_05P21 TaxID=723572 RepID=E7C4T1_9GAMM|nr:UDP-N-acetylglucosamine 2-epimerase [uncultured gamma proteobacterium HF0500_05P21]
MKKKICIVTGTRAEYGQLRRLIELVQKDTNLDLQLLVTGTHLSHEFGYTVNEIENDGFPITRELEMLISSDTPQSISKSTGLAMISFADAFSELRPNLVVLLGDRYEIFAAATSAYLAQIPIAHLHGGEITQGAFDDAIRHSITKMSWWHFVATAEFKKRVMQLGEDSSRIFVTGGMGVDMIQSVKLLEKSELEENLKCRFGERNLLITYHPETLGAESSKNLFGEIIQALSLLQDTMLFFTAPNSDTDGRIISKMIENYVNKNDNAYYFKSMGTQKFLSTLQYIDGIVGNSSSGITEVPSFKIATINLGDRQKGRPKAESVIDCGIEKTQIFEAIQKIYSKSFISKLNTVVNPYGEGGGSEKILQIIKSRDLPTTLQKEFKDVKQ